MKSALVSLHRLAKPFRERGRLDKRELQTTETRLLGGDKDLIALRVSYLQASKKVQLVWNIPFRQDGHRFGETYSAKTKRPFKVI
jgi:hypothetical protein